MDLESNLTQLKSLFKMTPRLVPCNRGLQEYRPYFSPSATEGTWIYALSEQYLAFHPDVHVEKIGWLEVRDCVLYAFRGPEWGGIFIQTFGSYDEACIGAVLYVHGASMPFLNYGRPISSQFIQ